MLLRSLPLALLLTLIAAPSALADVSPAGCFRTGPPSGACAPIAGPEQNGLDVVTTADGRWIIAAQGGLTVFERTPAGVAFRRCYGSAPGCEPSLVAPRQMALSSDGRFLYVSSDVGHHLAWLRLDPAAGTLTLLGCLDGPLGSTGCPVQRELQFPGEPLLSPDGRHLYLATGDLKNVIHTFALDPATGAPTYANCIQGRSGSAACAERALNLRNGSTLAIAPDGRGVYASGRGIDMFARDAATGQLRAVGCVDEDDEFGVCPMHAFIVNGASAAMSPDGAFVYFSVGATIRGWRRDARTQVLTPGPCLQQASPSEVSEGCVAAPTLLTSRNLAMAPDGQNLYSLGIRYDLTPTGTAGEVGLSEILRDPATGVLGLGDCVRRRGSTAFPCAGETDGFANVFSIDVSGDGSRLFSLASASMFDAGPREMAVFSRTPRPLPRPSAASAADAPPLVLADTGSRATRRAHVPVGCGAGAACTGTVTLELANARRTVLGRRNFRVAADGLSEVRIPLNARARRRLGRAPSAGLEARARIVRRTGEGAAREVIPVVLEKT